MKRIAALLLSLAMSISLAACGGTEKAGPEPAPDTAQESAPAPGAEAEENTLEPFSTAATIGETVLIDEDGVRITATGLEYTSYSAELKLTIENNREEDLCFTSGTLGYSCNSINGMMVEDGYLNCDVAAGKKAMDTISFRYASMQLYGIREIAELEIGLTATDAEFNSTDYPPKQIRTSAWSENGSPADFQNTINNTAAQNALHYKVLYFAADRLYENADVAVLSQAVIRTADGEPVLLIEAENRSQDMRTLSVSDIAINNLLVEDGVWTRQTLAADKRAILGVKLTSVLKEPYWQLYGLKEPGSISLSLQQYGMDGLPLTEKESLSIACGEAAPIDASGDVVYQENGLSVISKKIFSPEEGDGLHFSVMLLAENKGQDTLKLEIPFKTLSVNGFMADYFGEKWELKAGESAVLELQLFEQDLEEIGVTASEQISQVEFELELKRGKTVLNQSTVQMTVGAETRS